MKLWPTPSPSFTDSLDEIVFASRLIGSDSQLVLAGGGNTSIKHSVIDGLGNPVEVLQVKGSGWDLATIKREGFVALRLNRLHEMLSVPQLTDSVMMNELRLARLDSTSPDPSVESLLHAHLPGRVVIHTHADAMIAIMNQPNGAATVASLFADDAVVVPYVMPGFDLARLVHDAWSETETRKALVLMNHGLFTFGDTAEEAYTRHIELVQRASDVSLATLDPRASGSATQQLTSAQRESSAAFRKEISRAAGSPMLTHRCDSPMALAFANSHDVETAAAQGPATPDHVIRTKRLPLIGRDIDRYVSDYERYFHANESRRGTPLNQLDPCPRVVLDKEWGLVLAGRTMNEALIAKEIYLHTIQIIEGAKKLGGYAALPEGDVFDVEYWELEQAKLKLARDPGRFAGEVAVVTGAASGIGRACAAALLAQGAAVVGLDLNPDVVTAFDSSSWLGIQCNVADPAALESALSAAVINFGGVDMLVPAAGIFASSAPIASGDPQAWDRSFAVNVSAVAHLFRLAHPLLALAPNGGRVVLVASKNVAAPGPGASAYSASKAAAVQLSRVAALEWAPDNIRVNMVHPDAVFDTGLWTPELLEERARKYGVSVDDYKRRNLLGQEITSADVGSLVAEMCSSTFHATTGAQVPIDGGNERVI